MDHGIRGEEYSSKEMWLQTGASNEGGSSSRSLSFGVFGTTELAPEVIVDNNNNNVTPALLKKTHSFDTTPPSSPNPAASLGDKNRKFILLSLTYPAILGTIIWESLGAPFSSLLAWVAAGLIIMHFTLDFLYLKINIDYYGAESDFRYGWCLFWIDMVIIVLIRWAFTSSQSLPNPQAIFFHPYALFAAIYALYVLWENVYSTANRGRKRSLQTTIKEYYICLILFLICCVLHAFRLSQYDSFWFNWSCNGLFLMSMAYTVYKHYISVFLRVKQQ